MKPRLLNLCFMSVLCLSLAATAAAPKKRRAWITIGDTAFQKVQAMVPGMVPIGSRQTSVAGMQEKVHAVVVDESRIVEIASAIHQRMGQCGGFMYHATEAEARAALELRRGAAAVPAYGIDQREVIEPILASMQDKHIEATILALSGFTNRYYTSPSGVEAANWLLSAWRKIAAGREDISVALVTHKSYPQPSVTLTIAGTDLAAEKVVVGAHLDSILSFRMSDTARAPGADDDASGVASMTEALRALIASGYRLRRPTVTAGLKWPPEIGPSA